MPRSLHSLNYACPACQAVVAISHKFVGRRVDCPKCELPFLARLPESAPLIHEESTQPAEFTVNKPADDEDVLRELNPAMFRQYPFTFVGLWLLAAGLAIAGLSFSAVGAFPIGVLLFVLFALVLAYFGYWWLDVLSTSLRITNKRTTLRKGIIAKSTSEVQHDDVRNLQIHQTIWQRFLGVGDLAISSAGQDGLEIFIKGIAKPDETADFIRSMQ